MTATAERGIVSTGTGASTIEAITVAQTRTSSKSSVKGASANQPSGQNTSQGQTNKNSSFLQSKASSGTDTGGSAPDQSTSDGSIGVAAAIAVNISSATAKAAVLANLSTGGALTIHSSANADAIAKADASATLMPTKTVTFDPTASGVVVTDQNATDANTIKVGTNNWKNGDPVKYSVGSGGTAIGGLTDGSTYYVITVASDPTKIQLAASPADVSGNTPVTLSSGAAGTSHTLGGPDHSSGDGVGVAVAVNKADLANQAYIAGTATVTSSGLTVTADMTKRGATFDPSSKVDLTAGTIDVGNQGWETGDAVTYSAGGGTAIGGLTDGSTYFVIKTVSKTFNGGDSGVVDTSNGTIKVGSNDWKNGDAVVYDAGGQSPIGGLTDGKTYYVIANTSDPTKVKLAKTQADATASTPTPITLTGLGSGTQSLTRQADGTKIKLAASAADAQAGNAISLTSGATGTTHSLTEQVHTFSAKAIAGAGAPQVGVAGAAAINIVTDKTEAYLASGANLNANGGGLTMAATDTTSASATGTAKSEDGCKDGIGLGFALNIVPITTRAEVEDTVVLSGIKDLSLKATTSPSITTQADAGAAGSSFSLGGAVALNIGDTRTTARLGTATGTTTLKGAITLEADEKSGTITTTADGTASGKNVGIGAAVAINLSTDTASATTERSLSTSGTGASSVAASCICRTNTTTKASVKGESQKQPANKSDSQQQTDNNSNYAKSQAPAGTNTENDKSTNQQTSDGPVGVAAAISVNISDVIANAAVLANLTTGGALAVHSSVNADTLLNADGSAVLNPQSKSSSQGGSGGSSGGGSGSGSSSSSSGVGIGVAVTVNVAGVTNKAYIGPNAAVTCAGLSVTADMAPRNEVTFDPASAVSTTDNTIKVGANKFTTGDAVLYSSGGGTSIGGLTDGSTYYVIKDVAKTFDAGSSDVVDTNGGNTIKVGTNDWKTGDAVVYDDGGQQPIGGLVDGQTYYVITTSDSTKVKLAKTQADATAGTAITLNGLGSGDKQSLAHKADPTLIKLAASADDAKAGKAITLSAGATGTTHSISDQIDTLSAQSVAGAGSNNVGIAGSVAINIVSTDTEARIYSGSAGVVDNGALAIKASTVTHSTASATPSAPVSGGSVGVGASVALNIISNTVLAQINNGVSVTGTLADFTVDASAAHTVTTQTDAGSAGSDAISASVALSIVSDKTIALADTGTQSAASGLGRVQATHISAVSTIAKASAAGKSVAVGASVAVAVVHETASATLNRNLHTKGEIDILSQSSTQSTVEARGSATGSKSKDNGGKSADSTANDSVKSNPNTQQTSDLPTSSDQSSTANSQSESDSSSSSSSVNVAAAISVNVVFDNNSASIGPGSTGQPQVVQSDTGAIRVSATNISTESAKGTGLAYSFDLKNSSDNIGAALGLNYVQVTNTASVGANATLQGQGVTVEAVTPSGKANAFTAWGLSAAGGKGNVGVAGFAAINVVHVTTGASVADGDNIKSSGDMAVTARSEMGLQIIAGGGAISTGKVAVGAGVAINLITNTTTASLGNGSADATGNLSVTATGTISPLAVSIPVLGSLGVTSLPPVTSLAAGAGVTTSGSAGVAGSAVISIFNLTTSAYIAGGAQINQRLTPGATQSITIQATDTFTIDSGAGSLGVGTDGAGVGAGLDLDVLNKDTRAYIGAGAVAKAAGGITIEADSTETILSVATNVGGGSSAGIAGSASVQVITTGARAYVDDTPSGTGASLSAGGDVTITASDTFKATMIAGSIGVASSAGIGAANTTLVHSETVEAYVGQRASVSSQGTNGLSVGASSSEELITIAVAGGAAGTVGIAGSAVVNDLNETTLAFIANGATITCASSTGGTPGIALNASDDTTIVSVAGSIAVGGTAGVGVGADVGVFNKTTQARIGSNVTANTAGDIVITANSTEHVTSGAAGIDASGSASVGVNASLHVFNVKTRAFIGDDPSDNTPSAGPGHVHARGNVIVQANDESKLNAIVGVISVSGEAAVTAAGAVTVMDKTTEAFVGAGAWVTADGQSAGHDVRTGAYAPQTDTTTASYNPKTQTPQAIETSTMSGVPTDVQALQSQGDISLPTLPNLEVGSLDTNPSSTDLAVFTSGRRYGSPVMEQGFHGLAVTATNSDNIGSLTIGVAGAYVGVAVSAGVNVIKNMTRAYVGANGAINQDQSTAGPSQCVLVAAGSDFHHLAVVATLAAGAVGVSPAVNVTVLGNTTQAYLDAGSVVNANGDVQVQAHGREDLVLMGFGVAAGVVGVGGSVTVLTINNTTTASILGTASAGGDALVLATDDTGLGSVCGSLGAGLVGVGGSVGVASINKNTQAFIGDNAKVDALGAGAGWSGILDGTKTTDASGNEAFGTLAAPGVIVQAQSTETIFHLALTASGGFVGVAGAVLVTLVNSNTVAYIGSNAQINQTNSDASGTPNQGVFVGASDLVSATVAARFGTGGFVAVGAGITVGSIKNDTTATIRNGTNVRAKGNVAVNALQINDLHIYAFGGAGGFVPVEASVAVWTVGSQVEKTYTDNNNHSADAAQNQDKNGKPTADADADATQEASGSTSLVSGFLGSYGTATFSPASAADLTSSSIEVGNQGWQTGDALVYHQGGSSNTPIGGLSDGTTYYVINVPGDPTRVRLAASAADAKNGQAITLTSTGTGNNQSLDRSDYSRPPASANDGVGAAASQVAARLNSDAPSSTSLTGQINSAPTSVGSEASIAAGAAVQVGGNIQVTAANWVGLTTVVGGFSAGVFSTTAGITVLGVEANANAHADGTMQAGGDLAVNGLLDEELHLRAVSGAGGLVGVGGAVVQFTDSSAVQASLGDGAAVPAAGNVKVQATETVGPTPGPDPYDSANPIVETFVGNVSVGATGASFSTTTFNGSVTAYVGKNAQVGQTTAGPIGSLNVDATATIDANATTNAGTIGIGLAMTANFAFVTIAPTVSAQISDNAAVAATGAVLVEADGHFGVLAKVNGYDFGVFEIGASVSQATVTAAVSAQLGEDAVVSSAASGVGFGATVNNNDQRQIQAVAYSCSGGIIAGSGAEADATASPTVTSAADSGSSVSAAGSIGFVANATLDAESNAGGVGGGVVGIGASVSNSTINGATKADFGGDTLQAGTDILINAWRDGKANATSSAVTGGVLAVTVNGATGQITDEVRAYVPDGATLSAGHDLAILASSTADAHAKSGSCKVTGNLSIAASIGASEADATITPTVEGGLGADNASAGNLISVEALHNVTETSPGVYAPATDNSVTPPRNLGPMPRLMPPAAPLALR